MSKLFLSFILIILSMSSYLQVSYSNHPTTTEYIVQLKDTTIIKDTLKNTTIIVYIPADSINTISVAECDNLDMSQMKETVTQHNKTLTTIVSLFMILFLWLLVIMVIIISFK